MNRPAKSAINVFFCLQFCCILTASLLTGLPVRGQEKSAVESRPINALLVTGGCCHDYERQKKILTRGISARANVRWTVVHQGGKTTDTPIPLYDDPDWASGFDIVVHNECFSNVRDLEFVDRILQPHRNGTPAILIHCAMHCYRVSDDRWFRFVGMQSPGHGPHYSYRAENVRADHPIMKDFGPVFVAPKGELYHSARLFDSATALAQAKRQSDGKPQTCVWTNDYDGTRVFATTIGHYSETMVEPKYLDMLTRGMLWAVQRDAEKEFRPADESTDQIIRELATAPATPASDGAPQNCCGDSNVAFGKPVSAKSVQTGNLEKHLTDGRLDTRWCANGSQSNEWVVVDLEQPRDLQAVRLHWEKARNSIYKYRLETSADGETWNVAVDASDNKKKGGILAHRFKAPGTRYLKLTFLGNSRGLWGSLWELEASEGDLPELKTVQPTSSAIVADVDAPEGFEVTLFGTPPDINYPVCLTAAATGELFVGVDEQGSLGKEPGRGKILRCIDTDGDGHADSINEFARLDHPRGLVHDNDSLWVLHPPFLTVLHDRDRDGVAEERETLIEGISTDEVNKRGADHTTNGIRMGIDGWIYIAVGDFGFTKAIARDGRTLGRRGGGIVRIRPDGTEMEIFSWGQRNILDVSIDPYMNLFTRDNTNDGGGWDIRLSHILQTADYGYPSLYKNFSHEIMPPLADYGGGSGCGSMFFHDLRWPEPFDQILLTCDWGTSQVYSHRLPKNGATFDPQQDVFLRIPRPTDIDVDASGRMYVSSWKNGRFAYDGPDVGFVARITPVGFVPHPFPELSVMDLAGLVDGLNSPNATAQLAFQREILRRIQPGAVNLELLGAAVRNPANPLHGRVAALYTIAQIPDEEMPRLLRQLIGFEELREHALRALADRLPQTDGADLDPFLEGLVDPDPRVRSAAIIGSRRILEHALETRTKLRVGGREQSAEQARTMLANSLLPLTLRSGPTPEFQGDVWRQADPGRVIPHLAVQALAGISAVKECLDALDDSFRDGSLAALQLMHSPATVNGLFQRLSTARDRQGQRQIWSVLIRLYHREGVYKGGWWGTRPDTSGPYYDRQPWSETERIAAAVRVALSEADDDFAAFLREELRRHVVKLDGIDPGTLARMNEPDKAITLPKIDPDNPNLIANLAYGDVLKRTMALQGNPDRGAKLFRSQSCVNCHTFANGQQAKGPHLVDIGKRYRKEELVESIVDPGRKIAQGFDTWAFLTSNGKVTTGFVVLESAETVTLRQTDGTSREILQDDIEERVKQDISMMPKGIVGNITPDQLADLIAWLQTLH